MASHFSVQGAFTRATEFKLERAAFAVASILAPPRCLGCGVSLTGVDRSKPRPLCGPCTRELPWTPKKQCRHCGQPLISEKEICLRCREPEEPWLLSGLKSLFLYRGRAVPLIHALKGRGSRLVAAFIADQVIAAGAIAAKTRLLVPVPSSRAGRRRRGFDQAELLASAISCRCGIPWARLLLRTAGGEQKRLGRERRVDNIADQLRLRRPLPSNAQAAPSRGATPGACGMPQGDEELRILLIDDVATTGATAEAAARVLVSAGATEVSALVICRD